MYAKIFNQVLLSSLTQEQPIENRGVFFMLLAAADKKGYIIGTDAAIARVINVPLDIFTRALEALMETDPDSQSKEHDGKRIVRLEESPGLLVVNYEKYSGIGTDEQRREYFRIKKAESRARLKESEGDAPVKPVKSNTSDEVTAEIVYQAYPRKVGKPDAIRAIVKSIKQFGLDDVLKKTKAYAAARAGEDPQFTPHPATWFNGQRFNDDPSTWKNHSQESKKFIPPNPHNEAIDVPSI